MKFSKTFLLLFAFLAFALNANSQDSKIRPSVLNDVNPSSLVSGITSSKPVVNSSYLDAIGDLIGNYNVDSLTPGNAVSYGVVWTGSYYIISQFNANKFYRIRANWTLIDSFTVSGSTGSFRDMAFAKGLLWGVNTTNQIFGVDTATKTVVKTITCSGAATLRALCWDPVRNGFWVGTTSFTGPLVCVDTNGVNIPGASITTPASGLYSVGYDSNPTGPYLWIGTDQTPTSNTGTALVQYNAVTLAQIGSPINITVPLTTGAPLASGGGEVVTNLVPGKRTWVGLVQGTPDRVIIIDLGSSVAPPLSPFNLQTPTAGARIVTVPGSSTPVTITWDTSATGATYRFVFGNPTTTPRRFTIPSGTTNSITTTLGALDILLAANGFTNNGSASDSAVGQWDVWAYKGPGASGADSLKSTNGPRAITLRRQQVTLSPFALTAPASGITIITSPADPSPVTISWGSAGVGATYRWLFKQGATYSDPATVRLLADNAGLGTTLTLRNSQADSLLATLGVAPGDSVTGTWRVRAYSTDSLNSTAPDRQITLRRVGLLPLNQTFEDAAFPPLFWTLDGAGTQYWTRATTGATGSTASAKYDFWTATATTGPQTLTSNTFPPVVANLNYLKFDVAAAYYSATAIDSCVIETSTDAGTTWTRLVGMYQSTSLTSGSNSTPIMSTVSSTSQFTPTAAQWANKYYAMPVGTNKVRFIAKSAYGNNLYIDNVTSGGISGISTPISLTPDKFELNQNYPNPFNPTTKINFSIPKQSFVTLKIYDMLGREVVTLVNQEMTPNVYSVDFNASTLASGVYFYKLQAADFTDVKRMMLVK
ncbi:MAG: T9SS type A sorting domain-containing protein [Bacteroidetes bacterium]|nr:T9SS type A sorting domain-containing protein [Bacteroidota bacterium]